MSFGSKADRQNATTTAEVSLDPGDGVRGSLMPGTRLPIILEPVEPGAPGVNAATWAAAHRDTIDALLLTHGAILFRGFGITAPNVFQDLAAAVCTTLFEDNGEHERTSVSPSVYSPVFYPPEKHLLWHNENSFNHEFPTRICFGCVQPAAQGGETPVADSREVARRVDRGIYQRFLDKRVTYMRHYMPGLGLDWKHVFQTDSKADVEAIAKRQGMTIEWTKQGLKTRAVRPAIVEHPVTGEPIWFAQAQHWHPACLEPEIRETLLAHCGPDGLPRDCRYGDGSIIEDSVMEELCGIYRELEVVYPWRRGDVAVLENMLTAHARNPFAGPRKLFVAMGDMLDFERVREPRASGAED
jgi:alpha-ketoglutarate-dependent taurine dioxygenase